METCPVCRKVVKDSDRMCPYVAPDGEVYYYHYECTPQPLSAEEKVYFYDVVQRWTKILYEGGRTELADTILEMVWRLLYNN